MGNTWTVFEWRECDFGSTGKNWNYVEIYAGESEEEAMKVAREAKKNGVSCVKIEWR